MTSDCGSAPPVEPPWGRQIVRDSGSGGSSVCFERSDSRAHTGQYPGMTVQLPPAGITSKRLNIGFGHKETKGSNVDLSLLYMSEGPHPGDIALGFKSRVDPGTFQGAAGTTADRFTYTMVNKDDWEYNLYNTKAKHARETLKAAKNGTEAPSSHQGFLSAGAGEEAHAWLDNRIMKPQPKGRGECTVDARTDPITHFRHEGVVFKDPWKPQKRTGYNAKATTQTWTWQTNNEQPHHSEQTPGIKVSKNVLDCRGRMHYLNAGEEDMIPAATNNYIKSDRKPTDAHVLKNDKTQLSWVFRTQASPRNKFQSHGSEQIWDCMVYEYTRSASVGDMSVQCDRSVRSESQDPTPMRAAQSPRGSILSSCQSEPQLSRGWQDDRTPFRPADSLSSVTENVPPIRNGRPEDLGSTVSAEKLSYRDWRRAKAERGSVTSRSGGMRTPQSARGGRRPPGSATSQGSWTSRGARRQSVTPSDASGGSWR